MDKLKRINQQGIKSLLKDRLENPAKYRDIPLIIWRSNLDDGIQEEILYEVFDEYNQGRSEKERKWYRRTFLGGDYQTEHDLSNPHEFRSSNDRSKFGVHQVGILAVDPLYMSRDYKRDASSPLRYQSLLNHRRWEDIKIQFDAPVVAYMLFTGKEFETPEKYPNAEQYVFEPDFEQWADWALSNNIVPQFIIDFIRGDGNRDGITYRWYNIFNMQKDDTNATPKGVVYPKKWYKVLIRNSAADGTTKFVIRKVRLADGISSDVADQFKKYIADLNII